MSLTLLLGLIGIHLLALMVPGPDFFLVLRTSLTYGWRETVSASIGVALGVIIWAALAVLGIRAIFQQFPFLNLLLMGFAVVYLFYLGSLLLREAWQRKVVSLNAEKPPANIKRNFFLTGLLTNLSNPKAIMYFASVFAGILAKVSSPTAAWWILAVVSLESLLYFLLIGRLFSYRPVQHFFQRKQYWVDGICGVVFIAFALFIGVDLMAVLMRE